MAGILNTRDLTFMRDLIDGNNHNLFPDTCDIYRAVHTTDAAGADVLTYPGSPTLTSVPCRLDQISTRYRDEKERSASMMITAIPELQITVPWTTELHTDDHIVASGATYEVEREMTDSSWPGVNQAHVRRINEA